MDYKIYFKDNFQYLAFRERAALSNFEKLYNAFPEELYFKHVNPYDGNDRYDCLYNRHNDGFTIKRLFIEIKVRDQVWETYYMEPKKFNDIKHIAEENLSEDEYEIIYINFTPEGTFIWNVSKLKREGKISVENKMANKATAESRDDKIDKKFYVLNKSDARFYGYYWEESQIKKHIEDFFISKQQKQIELKKKIGFTF